MEALKQRDLCELFLGSLPEASSAVGREGWPETADSKAWDGSHCTWEMEKATALECPTAATATCMDWQVGASVHQKGRKGTGIKNAWPPIEFRKGGDCAAPCIAHLSLAGAGSTLLCEEREPLPRTIEEP